MPQQQPQTREEQHWRTVRMREYRLLGNRLAALEALAAGLDPVAAEDPLPTPGAEPMLVGERQACLKAQVRLVLRALQASLQAVLDARPQIGEDVTLVEVQVVCGLEELQRASGTDGAEKARLN